MFRRRDRAIQCHASRFNLCDSTRTTIVLLFVVTSLLTFMGCNAQPNSDTNIIDTSPTSTSDSQSNPSTAEDSYPAPVAEPTAVTEPYPAPTSVPQTVDSYPSPSEVREGTLLAINTPIKAGDTEVTGVGPSGLTVFLVNVTLMGEQLGSSTIGSDGTFAITVSPLPANIQVGLFADLEGAGIAPDSVIPGEGARAVPLVGFYYDTALVSE